jgi:hypothetical protein
MAIPAELQGKASGDAVYFPLAAFDIGSGNRGLGVKMYGQDSLGAPAPFVLLDGSVAFTPGDPVSVWTQPTAPGVAVTTGVNVIGPTSISMIGYRGIRGHFKPDVAGTLTFDWSEDADFSEYYVRDTERQVAVTTAGITINCGRFGDYARMIFTAAGNGFALGGIRKDRWEK